MALIIISGTPGTGKSTLAVALAKKLGWKRIDLHEHYKELTISYNKKKKCYDLDKAAFIKLVRKKIKEYPHIIIDSHIAHLLPAKMVRLCMVLVCSDLKKLKKRLEARKYSAQKIRENMDAEIFQICLMEARERRHKVVVVDTATMKIKDIVGKIAKSL